MTVSRMARKVTHLAEKISPFKVASVLLRYPTVALSGAMR